MRWSSEGRSREGLQETIVGQEMRREEGFKPKPFWFQKRVRTEHLLFELGTLLSVGATNFGHLDLADSGAFVCLTLVNATVVP